MTLESEQASLQIPEYSINLAYVDDMTQIEDPVAISFIIELIKTYTVIEMNYESTGYVPFDWDSLFSVTENSDG